MRAATIILWGGLAVLLAAPVGAAEPDPAPDPAENWSGYVAWCSRHAGTVEVGGKGVGCRQIVSAPIRPPAAGDSRSSVDWEDFRAKEAEAEAFRRWRR